MTTPLTPEPGTEPTDERRIAQRTRHARSVAQLMEQRAELRGVLPLADLVEESLRWTA